MSDDLISRQAAIDAAKKLLDYYGTDDISKEFADHTAEQFMNRVPSAQPEQKKGKWILLSEKVPEMDERVLVIDNGYEYHVWDCMSNRGDEYFWEDEEGLCHNKYEVVAWLPFPGVIL